VEEKQILSHFHLVAPHPQLFIFLHILYAQRWWTSSSRFR